ncbi:MAG TPA: carbamate kinase [Actinomycetota bacterium]|nr:carbamate kinase [Actinomycetota bacterium]
MSSVLGPLVVALGGNAISPVGEVDTIENQFEHARATAARLVRLIDRGWDRLVITHGNGPQVGNVVTRVEMAAEVAPWLPLDICVADTGGGMGYMIQQCLQNALAHAGLERRVATLITQVEVDAGDSAFEHPAKPIGPARRLVASPRPQRVVESEVISAMVSQGIIVIAGGGGGVPVVRDGQGLKGVEAVIDKDLTAALIAHSIGATAFMILTDVDGAYLDHGKIDAHRIENVSVVEMRRLWGAGAFPAGSMGPKVDAACGFIESGGTVAVIAALDDLEAAIAGAAGTRISAS